VPDGAVVLGSCSVQAGAFVGTGTTVGRQYSGTRLPAAGDLGAALTTNGAIDTAQLSASLTLRRDALSAPGPTLSLLNGGGGANAATSIDFATYDPVGNDPSSRIRAIDDGHFSNALVISTKAPGANVNRLIERMRVNGDGATINGNLSVAVAAVVGSNLTVNGSSQVVGNGSYGGVLNVSGASIRNFAGHSIVQTNANDWLRVNPDSQFPGTAMHNPVAIGTGGLSIGTWEQLPQGQLHATGSATIGADLVVGASATIRGAGLYGGAGFRLFEMNAGDWLRVNPDQTYPATAIYKPVAIGTGGLAIGEWSQQPQGALKVTGNATINGTVAAAAGGKLGAMGFGGTFYGTIPWPYESIQMDPGNNFRIYFASTQRFTVENTGQVTIRLANGFWVFQTDGNLVKYNNAGTAIWALNKQNGSTGW
jgi:hypothetical protein